MISTAPPTFDGPKESPRMMKPKTAVSEKMGYTLSGISRMRHALEEEAGFPLKKDRLREGLQNMQWRRKRDES